MLPVWLVEEDVSRLSHGNEFTHKLANSLARMSGRRVVVASGVKPEPDSTWGPELYRFQEIRAPGRRLANNPAPFHRGQIIGDLLRGIRRRVYSMAFLSALREKLWREQMPIIVHLLGGEYTSNASFVRAVKSWRRHRVVLSNHPADFDRSGWSAQALYKRAVRNRWRSAIELADAVLVHGESIRDRLILQLSLPDSVGRKIFVGQWPSDAADRRLPKLEARRLLGIPAAVPVALAFGLIRPDKRIDIAIQACAKARSDLWLVIAGAPLGISADAVRQWIRESKMDARVLFVPKWIEESDVATYYSAADVFLATHSSATGSQSGPLSQCRTFRLPAVVSDNTELGCYVIRTKSGLVARVNDASHFAEQLVNYFSNSAIGQEMRVALGDVAVLHSWDGLADACEMTYERIAGTSVQGKKCL